MLPARRLPDIFSRTRNGEFVFRSAIRAAKGVGFDDAGSFGARDGELVFPVPRVGFAQGVKSLACGWGVLSAVHGPARSPLPVIPMARSQSCHALGTFTSSRLVSRAHTRRKSLTPSMKVLSYRSETTQRGARRTKDLRGFDQASRSLAFSAEGGVRNRIRRTDKHA